MPIVGSKVANNVFLPTVAETFGLFVDKPIARCAFEIANDHKHTPSLPFAYKYCPAEFCYLPFVVTDHGDEDEISCFSIQEDQIINVEKKVQYRTYGSNFYPETIEKVVCAICGNALGKYSEDESTILVTFNQISTYWIPTDNAYVNVAKVADLDSAVLADLERDRDIFQSRTYAINHFKKRHQIPVFGEEERFRISTVFGHVKLKL